MDRFLERVVVASDSFKGSLTSRQAGYAMAEGVRRAWPGCDVDVIAVADGGEGLVDAISTAKRHHTVADSLHRPINCCYGLLDDGQTAVVETASCAGMALLPATERNPLVTTTLGVGQLMAHAIGHGAKKILIGLGGSSTNDAGIGLLSALGFKFLDSAGHEVPLCGAGLEMIDRIDSRNVIAVPSTVKIVAVCDVTAPFCGPEGAAYVFGPQKGASQDDVERLDRGLRHFAAVMKSATGVDVSHMPGAGAAGGIGGSLRALLGARLCPGIEVMLDVVAFDNRLSGTSLVITGEGHADSQTLLGKAPWGVLQHSRKAGVPVMLVAGKVDNRAAMLTAGFMDAIEATPSGMAPQDYMQPAIASENLANAVYRVLAQSNTLSQSFHTGS